MNCVADLAASLGARTVVETVTVDGPGGPEGAARDARRAALRAVGVREGAPILLGHTMDDQAETVLLRLASIGYGPATFQMTYIPGTYNNGNVYFAWARIQF